MIGLIIADLAGTNGIQARKHCKEPVLSLKDARYGTATIHAVATADWLLNSRGYDPDDLVKFISKWFWQEHGLNYSEDFRKWILSQDRKPYGCGDATALLRACCTGEWAHDLEEARRLAAIAASISHDSESVTAAEAVAAAVYLPTSQLERHEILNYISDPFDYPVDAGLAKMKEEEWYIHSGRMAAVVSLRCFLESHDYRSAVANGIDYTRMDNIPACIAGAIAAWHYTMPPLLAWKAKRRLPEDILKVVVPFDKLTR